MPLGPEPFQLLPLGGGATAPLYMVRFDDKGQPLSPQTADAVVDQARGGAATDVVILCHGWNNVFADAVERYRAWATGLIRMTTAHPLGRPFRPVFVGVIWPSTALVWPAEEGPGFAAGDPDAQAHSTAADLELLDGLTARLSAKNRARAYTLAGGGALTGAEALELVALFDPLYAKGDVDLGAPDTAGRTAQAVIDATRDVASTVAGAAPAAAAPAGFGIVGAAAGAPQAAGGLAMLDPRVLLRVLTVWQMKDRAGVVGAKGLGPLLRRILGAGAPAGAAPPAVHLVGHSFGARVCLSAICHPPSAPLPRRVTSLLLLQPATNHLCFAADVDGRPGGYRGAFGRVERAIASTHSKHDFPLTRVFHLALRRAGDLGDARIAAGGAAPSRYAALGGFGPDGADAETVRRPIADPGQPLDLGTAATRVVDVDGERTIGGHGDVINDSVAWTLHRLVKG